MTAGTYTIPTQSALFPGSAFGINSGNCLGNKGVAGGPTRIRTWDQRIMSPSSEEGNKENKPLS